MDDPTASPSHEKLDAKTYASALLTLYGEQVVHGRHHETVRFQSTNMIVVLSSAILGALTINASTQLLPLYWGVVVLGVLLAILNAFAWALSFKYYERNRLHQERGSAYRREFSRLAFASGFNSTERMRRAANSKHRKNYRVWHTVRLNMLVGLLHGLLIVVGLLLVFAGLLIFPN